MMKNGNVQGGMAALARVTPTTYGTPGQADIQGLGLVTSTWFLGKGITFGAGVQPPQLGRFLAIEAKMPGRVWEDEQQNWAAMVKRFGGIYILARSCDDVERGLREEGIL